MAHSGKYAISRSPYRITLGGGGTDLPFYAKKRGGMLISAAIDEYITVMVARRTIDQDLFLQYSKTERVSSLKKIQHNILREVLQYFKITDSFQVATFSTMPTFTGLGASSTLIVSLIKAIRRLKNDEKAPADLAKEAFHIEREILGLSGGFQDQFIASLGGIQLIEIDTSLNVKTTPLEISPTVLEKIKNSFFLIYSGVDRNSEKIIDNQTKDFKNNENKIIEAYDKIKEIGKNAINDLQKGNLGKLAREMDLHWEIKKSITGSMTNNHLDDKYLKLKSLGSEGGKIIGAGGGGFFLMVVEKNQNLFKKKLIQNGFKAIDFSFDFKGAHIIG